MREFSIIIPAYNLEEYIEDCIMSVMNQSYKSFEIVVVNDGSTDDTGLILSQLRDKYKDHIIYIEQENHGLSHARNTAMRRATGRYVLFLDGDDYWAEDMLGGLAEVTQAGHDVILGNGFICDYGSFVIHKSHELIAVEMDKLEKEEAFLKFLHAPYRGWTVWEHVYRLEFLKDRDLYFREGIVLEDVEWTYKVILEAESLGFFDIIYYYYRAVRPGSIMYGYSYSRWLDLVNVCEEWIVKSKQIEHEELQSRMIEIHAKMCFKVIREVGYMKKADQPKATEVIKSSQFIGLPTDDQDKQMVKIAKIIGMGGLIKLIKWNEQARRLVKRILGRDR